MLVGNGDDEGGAGSRPPEVKINPVYDTRTITPAKWAFEHFITFLESVTYRFHGLWKSSTPAASTILKYNKINA